MSVSESQIWFYVRLHFPATVDDAAGHRQAAEASERFLLRCALPEFTAMKVEGVCRRHFFIRYAEGGYHLRLRCLCDGEASASAARERLHAAIDRFMREDSYAFGGAADAAELVREGRLVEDTYLPELDKYCGPDGMDLAERHFERCSTLVGEAMDACADGLNRDQLALWLMGQALVGSGLSPLEILAVMSGHARYWWSAFGRDPSEVEAIMERTYANKREALSIFLPGDEEGGATRYALAHPAVERRLGAMRDLYRDTLQGYIALERAGGLHSSAQPLLMQDVSALASFGTVAHYPMSCLLALPNLIHMMNNRLGVDVGKEAQLAYFTARAFGERAGMPAPSVPSIPIHLEPSLRAAHAVASV